jgi:hypothetical protein
MIRLHDPIVNMKISDMICSHRIREEAMGLAASEKELAERTSRFLKAEMKRAGVTYAELAKRLEAHGLQETQASLANKLSRGTIAATLLIASLAALELTGFQIEDL